MKMSGNPHTCEHIWGSSAHTFLIQPQLLVGRVQQSDVELTSMTWCRLTWMLIACYCSCKSGRNEEKMVLRQKQHTQKHWSICPLLAVLALKPSGRTAFSQDVSFSAWGSREQQEVELTGSEKPESVVRVLGSEDWEERESAFPEWGAEAWAHSAWDSGSREWLSSSWSPAPAVLLPPMASSLGPRPSEEPAGIGGRSPRHWDVSGDVRPDWKGGWNTLTENLHWERHWGHNINKS